MGNSQRRFGKIFQTGGRKMNKKELKKYHRILDDTEEYWKNYVVGQQGSWVEEFGVALKCPLCIEREDRVGYSSCNPCLVVKLTGDSCHNVVEASENMNMDKRYIYRYINKLRRLLEKHYRKIDLFRED